LKSYLDQYGSAYKTFTQWFNQDTLLTKLEKISESELSDILKKPSKENLNELLCKLDIPANGFKVNLKRSPKEIPKLVGNNDSLGLFYYFQNHSTPAAVFNQMHQCPWASDKAAFTDFRKRCTKQREILKERYSIFEKIKAADYPSETQPAVFSEHFPVVFVTESAHIEPYCMEYRSRFPLKLGVNIHLIATDTEEHHKEIEQYLVEKCNLQNMEVILIDKLRDPSFRPKIREISPEIMAIEQSQKPPPQPAEIVEELIIPDITEEQGVPDTEPKATNTISMMVLSGFISALGGLAVALAFTLLNAAALTLAGVLVAGAGVLAIGAGLASLGFFAYQHRATISHDPLEPSLQSP